MAVMDFGDVAARIAAGLSGVRACLVVSRDGLSLGAHPAEGEDRAREVWDRLEQVGDLTRGFVEMGLELWVFGRRGPYGAVVVASPDVKPGLVLDRIEAGLVSAEQARAAPATEEPVPQPRPEPVRRPRSPLHPEPRLGPADPSGAPEPTAPEAGARAAGEPAGNAGQAVVDLSGVRDPQPEVTEPAAESAPEPKASRRRTRKATTSGRKSARPAAGAPEQPAEPEQPAQHPAEQPEQTSEHVPAFTPASAPQGGQAGDVYVAGVRPADPEGKAMEASPKPMMAPKQHVKRRFRRKDGEVDRVALAREFGLLSDEFGV